MNPLRFDLEKIQVKIFNSSEKDSEFVAQEIASIIKSRQAQSKPCVLGLATGSTPTRVYTELIRMHQKEHLSFKNVHTFNLDEYFLTRFKSLLSGFL